jgi:hypothetical protein
MRVGYILARGDPISYANDKIIQYNEMAFLSTILALLLAACSGYSLSYSWSSIPRLRTYERKAEKAAEWSNVAQDQLWKTRYTVASGFIAVGLCILFLLSH